MLEALAALAKALLYLGVLSAAGAVFAEATLRVSSERSAALAALRSRGAWLTIVATAASVGLLILRLGGDIDAPTLSAIFVSSAGAAIALQLAGAFLLLISAHGPNDAFMQGMRLTYAALLTVAFMFSGHAGATSPIAGLVAFVHVSLAAWWVGSLVLLREACSSWPIAELQDVLGRFSARATMLVGGLVAAGAILILALVDFEARPLFSRYVQLLLLKVCIAAGVLALATYNKFRLTPQIHAAEPTAVARLSQSVLLELVLIAAVAAATAGLTMYGTEEPLE